MSSALEILSERVRALERLEHFSGANAGLATAVSALLIFPGLRGLWTGGAFNGAGEAVDVSGNGLHLTRSAVQMETPGAATPYLAPQAFFSTTAAYLEYADGAAVDLVGDEAYVRSGQAGRGLTVGMWIRPNSVGLVQRFMSKLGAAGQRSFVLGVLDTNALIFQVSSDGTAVTSVSSAAGSLVANEFQFIAARWRSETPQMSVWHNLTAVSSSAPAAMFNSTAAFRIGAAVSGDGFVGRGSMMFLCHAAVPDAILKNYVRLTAPLYGVAL